MMHGLKARLTSELQNRRPLFDVELYLTVHKSFVSTSLNIINRGCKISAIPIGLYYFIIQTNINSDKKHNTMASVQLTMILS